MRAVLQGLVCACLVSLGVACLEMSPAQIAAGVQSSQCEGYLRAFKKGHAAGLSCPAARAAAEKAEPLCALTFDCPAAKDAGTDADLDGGGE
jgi:hypothetical protein